MVQAEGKDDTISYIMHQSWSKSRLGLERIRVLMERMGNPERKLKFVHVAGTNGKGSTCAMLASVLQGAGYRTGLYISPYIRVFNERIQVDGRMITDGELSRVTEQIRRVADEMKDHPTEFEMITAIAFQHFLDQNCDIVVLEVGLGGRLDSTNVIGVPEVAVITSIGLDHTKELGETLSQIAGEKAGIIKAGGQVVAACQEEEAVAVIRRRCREKNAPLTEVDLSRLIPVSQNLNGQVFHFGSLRNLEIILLGRHQLINAAGVLTAVEVLRERGWDISETAVREGLRNTRWPGRLEVLRRDPLLIADVGHNPQGIRAAAQSLRELFPGRTILFLMGVLEDKDYHGMLTEIAPLARRLIAVTPDSPRALTAHKLAQAAGGMGIEAQEAVSLEEGLRKILELAGSEDVVCALGSFYTVTAIRDLVRGQERGEP